MAFGTQDDTDEVMNEINMTPLVDVMLVLLIIFIITVPVMKHAVNIGKADPLPREGPGAHPPPPTSASGQNWRSWPAPGSGHDLQTAAQQASPSPARDDRATPAAGPRRSATRR